MFTLQIYSDFSGYTAIARGVGAVLGVTSMKNFEQPYLSRSITEFWRWRHMSPSAWLRDHLYVPLGETVTARSRPRDRTFPSFTSSFSVWGQCPGAVCHSATTRLALRLR